MKSKERMLKALNLKKPDRLPATIHRWQGDHLGKYMGGLVQLTYKTGGNRHITWMTEYLVKTHDDIELIDKYTRSKS